MGMTCVKAIDITIQCKFFFIFIGLEPTYCVWLQVIFCSCVNETTLFSFLWSLLHENGRSLCSPKNKLGDWIIKTIIDLSYHKISWFVSVWQINHLPQPSASANNWSARHWQITIYCSTWSNNKHGADNEQLLFIICTMLSLPITNPGEFSLEYNLLS